jgi:uncharacterized protein YjbJ (UPF0337 family)
MAGFKRKYKNLAEKFSGKAKEIAGKITNNNQLELKGKVQASKAQLKDNLSISNRMDDIKEAVAEKINDTIDGKHKSRK